MRALPGKVTMMLRQGEILHHHQAGGGGHGDAWTRDPEAVARDIWNGKVSAEAARVHHGVVVDAVSGRLDPSATDTLRKRIQQP